MGTCLIERGCLGLEAGPPEQRPEPTQVTEELAAADLRTPGAGENLMRDDNQNKHGKFSARGLPQPQTETPIPTQGVVWVNGSSYAWHVGAGGLQLIPTETGGSESVDGRRVGVPRRVSASDVLEPRARSPFERHPGAQSEPQESRALRPSVSEPQNALEWDQSRDRQGELTWYGASLTAPLIAAEMSSASVVDRTAMAATDCACSC